MIPVKLYEMRARKCREMGINSGNPDGRRKQRQAEDLLKTNVCIPIVGFLYARVGAHRHYQCE